MITIFYIPAIQYVLSVHPNLYRQLALLNPIDIRLINANDLDEKQVDILLDESRLVVIDHSLIEALFIGNEGRKEYYPFLYFPKFSNLVIIDHLIKKLIGSRHMLFYWASINDLHNLERDMNKLRKMGYSENALINRVNGIIWFFNSDSFQKIDLEESKYIGNNLELVDKCKDVLQKIPNKKVEIEIPHCIDIPKQIKGLRKRYDIFVPGVQYPTRKIANSSVTSQFLKAPNIKPSFLFYGKLNGLILRTPFFRPYWTYAINQALMNSYISKSKFSFVCGGPLRYFVRKFLEVPIAGSVLIAYPPINFFDYGFEDKVHYISSKPEEVGKVVKEYIGNSEFQRDLIHNALNLVAELHSTSARAKNLAKALQLAAERNLTKAAFLNSRYTYWDGKGEKLNY